MELDGLGVLLGVKPPWVLKIINVQNHTQVIDVYIEYERGSKFECPNCGELCKVHNGKVKRIRHLDLFDYRCYLRRVLKIDFFEFSTKQNQLVL